MLTTSQQATAALFYVQHHLSNNPSTSSLFSASPPAHASTFLSNLSTHFITIYGIFTELYGSRLDCLDQLVSLITECAESYLSRPADMLLLDQTRAGDPEWFLSNKMLGGVCYVDLYAINLPGLLSKIPYFKSLGLTYLHLMPLFKRPQPLNDGGYAVSSYREVEPKFGNFEQLKQVAKELRENGISLVVDFVFNHTSNEHEWAQRAVKGEEEYEGYYWIFPDRNMPDQFERTT